MKNNGTKSMPTPKPKLLPNRNWNDGLNSDALIPIPFWITTTRYINPEYA